MLSLLFSILVVNNTSDYVLTNCEVNGVPNGAQTDCNISINNTKDDSKDSVKDNVKDNIKDTSTVSKDDSKDTSKDDQTIVQIVTKDNINTTYIDMANITLKDIVKPFDFNQFVNIVLAFAGMVVVLIMSMFVLFTIIMIITLPIVGMGGYMYSISKDSCLECYNYCKHHKSYGSETLL